MGDVVIRVEALSKRYQLGELHKYKAFRDTLTDAMYFPFRLLRNVFRSSSTGHKTAKTIWALKDVSFEIKQDEIVAFAEVEQFIDTQVKFYSSGMYMRLAFAVAGHLDPEILLVDEVLAVGDAEFQKKCLGKMGDVAKEGMTVFFVSHNMAALRS